MTSLRNLADYNGINDTQDEKSWLDNYALRGLDWLSTPEAGSILGRLAQAIMGPFNNSWQAQVGNLGAQIGQAKILEQEGLKEEERKNALLQAVLNSMRSKRTETETGTNELSGNMNDENFVSPLNRPSLLAMSNFTHPNSMGPTKLTLNGDEYVLTGRLRDRMPEEGKKQYNTITGQERIVKNGRFIYLS